MVEGTAKKGFHLFLLVIQVINISPTRSGTYVVLFTYNPSVARIAQSVAFSLLNPLTWTGRVRFPAEAYFRMPLEKAFYHHFPI